MLGGVFMNLIFYRNYSERYALNKNITEMFQTTGKLKENTDIINPTYILKKANEVLAVNYCFDVETERYYFIQNVKKNIGGFWEVQCAVDVLMSYRDGINNLDVVTKRQENVYNTYLNDTEFKTYNYPRITQKKFPIGFTSNSHIILTVAGGVN